MKNKSSNIKELTLINKKILETEKELNKLEIKRNSLLLRNSLLYCDECEEYYPMSESEDKIVYWEDSWSAPETELRCPKKHILEWPKSRDEWPRTRLEYYNANH